MVERFLLPANLQDPLFDPARVHSLCGIRPRERYSSEVIPGTLKFGCVVQPVQIDFVFVVVVIVPGKGL